MEISVSDNRKDARVPAEKRKRALRQLRELKKLGRPMRLAADGWANNWQTLIAIILSARTRDEVTIKICSEMFKKYSNPKKFSKLSLGDVEKLIRSINFYHSKAKRILGATQKIVEKFGGRVPLEFDKLLSLPGVGRKTANVFLTQIGGNRIGVDTHVKYISNYLGWVQSKNPLIIEKELEKLFPRRKWREVNNTLVTFGKTYTSRREKDGLLEKIGRL